MQTELSSHRAPVARSGSFQAGGPEQPHFAGVTPGLRVRHRSIHGWYCSEPRLAFNRIVVVRYRMHLESRGLAANTINQQLAAVRRLAHEAADSGLLSPELAAGISRVKGVKQLGFRSGNWLTVEQSSQVLGLAAGPSLRAKRDYAMLAMLFGCGLRRSDLVGLQQDEVQMR